MPMYHIVSADHFNVVLGQARNGWVACFCQFLWVVRLLNVWLLHCTVGIMLGKENQIKSTHIWSLNSKHRKVSKATVGNLNMRVQMWTVSFNRLRLDCTGCHSCCYDKQPFQVLLAMLEMWETKKGPTALQFSLQCDFRLEVVDKERLTDKLGKGEI